MLEVPANVTTEQGVSEIPEPKKRLQQPSPHSHHQKAMKADNEKSYSPKQPLPIHTYANLSDLPNELLFQIVQLVYGPAGRSPAFELAHVNRRLRAFALPHAFECIRISDVSYLTPLWTYFSRRPLCAIMMKSLHVNVGYYDVPEASFPQQEIVATYPVTEFEHLGREICSHVHDIRLSKLHGILRNTIHLTYLSLTGISIDYALILMLRELPCLRSLDVDHIEDYCLASDDEEDNVDPSADPSGVRSFHPPPLPASCFPALEQLSISHHPRRYDLTNKEVTCYHPIHVLFKQCHTTLRHLRVKYCPNKETDSDATDFSIASLLNCKFHEGSFDLHSLTLEGFPIDFHWLATSFVEPQPNLRSVDLHPSQRFTVKDAKRLPGFWKATDKKSLISLSYLLDHVQHPEAIPEEEVIHSSRASGGGSSSSEDGSHDGSETGSHLQVVELALEMSVEITASFMARLAQWFPYLRKLTLSSTLGTLEPFDVFLDEFAAFKHLTHLSLPWIPDDWVRTPDPRIFLMSRIINPPLNNYELSPWYCLDCSLGICSTTHDANQGTGHRSPMEEWKSDSEGAVFTAVQLLAKRMEQLVRFNWYPLTPVVGERCLVWTWDITRKLVYKPVENSSSGGARSRAKVLPPNIPTSEVVEIVGDLLYPERPDPSSESDQVPIYQCRVQGLTPTRWA